MPGFFIQAVEALCSALLSETGRVRFHAGGAPGHGWKLICSNIPVRPMRGVWMPQTICSKKSVSCFSLSFISSFLRTFPIWALPPNLTIDDNARLPCASCKGNLCFLHKILTIDRAEICPFPHFPASVRIDRQKAPLYFRLPKTLFFGKNLCVRANCEHEDDWKTQVNTDCGNRFLDHIRKLVRTERAIKKVQVIAASRETGKSCHRFLPFFDIMLCLLAPDFRQVAVPFQRNGQFDRKKRTDHGYHWYCKVFQHGQGLRLHYSRWRRQGCVRSHFCCSGFRHDIAV